MIDRIISELKEAFTIDFGKKKCRWCSEKFNDGEGFDYNLCSKKCAREELLE